MHDVFVFNPHISFVWGNIFCTGRPHGGTKIGFFGPSTSLEIRWRPKGPIAGPYNACVSSCLDFCRSEIGLSIWFQSPCVHPKAAENRNERKQRNMIAQQRKSWYPRRFALDLPRRSNLFYSGYKQTTSREDHRVAVYGWHLCDSLCLCEICFRAKWKVGYPLEPYAIRDFEGASIW